MTTNHDDGLDDEDRDDSRMYRDGLLNGDEKFNRFVKLTDSRFDSAARRANKARKELRDEFAQLRTDLAPLIEFARVVAVVSRYAPIVAGVVGTAGTVALAILGLGIWP